MTRPSTRGALSPDELEEVRARAAAGRRGTCGPCRDGRHADCPAPGACIHAGRDCPVEELEAAPSLPAPTELTS